MLFDDFNFCSNLYMIFVASDYLLCFSLNFPLWSWRWFHSSSTSLVSSGTIESCLICIFNMMIRCMGSLSFMQQSGILKFFIQFLVSDTFGLWRRATAIRRILWAFIHCGGKVLVGMWRVKGVTVMFSVVYFSKTLVLPRLLEILFTTTTRCCVGSSFFVLSNQ